eukprot:CAMPEP_0172508030 /NCGR_PEP_ID=MMETSP1066-20121228/208644_1 /TAXON_ID=671091 /ORGANISM="Coscinodiscus wailesii, Strain CCMP2513" /LENGTH=63 /DNA_ID=CAMNT_0013285825 /DNA_START=45 /DNA_END=233 /DNA_ORIENTATION=-
MACGSVEGNDDEGDVDGDSNTDDEIDGISGGDDGNGASDDRNAGSDFSGRIWVGAFCAAGIGV